MLKRTSGTKLSTLSSVPFGCCHLWSECNHGRRGCSHVDYDPDYANLCACFNRNRGIRQEEAWLTEPTPIKKNNEAPLEAFEVDAQGQLILF